MSLAIWVLSTVLSNATREAALQSGRDAQARGELATAERAFTVARTAPAGSLVRCRASLWAGEVAIVERDYARARSLFDDAAVCDDALLRFQIGDHRRGLAQLAARARLANAAWVALALSLLALAWRARAARSWAALRPPGELVYALPVFAALIGACPRAHDDVRAALVFVALGSALLIYLSALASRQSPPKRVTSVAAHAALLVCSSAAVLYLALDRSDLIGRLWITLSSSRPLVG